MKVDVVAIGISVLSFLFAVVSFVLVRRLQKELAKLEEAAFFVGRNVGFEGRLAEWPEAFKFYGIDLDNAKWEGVSPEQIAYLVLSTNAMVAYCISKKLDIYKHIESSSYRRLMYSQLRTRLAWKYARRFFSAEYRDGVDRYLGKKYSVIFEKLED